MKELLLVDCCIRGSQSRTRKIADAFLEAVDQSKFHITEICPEAEGLRPLTGAYFEQRERLLADKRLDHPRFFYAHQFAQADVVVLAAPFWDLSIPAMLKIYIENVTVEGISFGVDADGIYGTCRGSRLILLTTRGTFYENSDLEQGSRYIEALHRFYNFGGYTCIAAEGLDMPGTDIPGVLADACGRARGLAASLS